MRVTIKGLTPSTIAFNTLGIIIRGDSRETKLYPESIARHINVVNENQLTEVNSLVNAGLISIEVEDVPEKVKKPINAERIFSTNKTDNSEKTVDNVEAEKKSKKTKNKKNKTKSSKKTPKNTVKRKEESKDNEETEKSNVVVMTPNGAVEGKMQRNFTGEIEDGEKTKASIEAMKKIVAEEQADAEKQDIDESKLDISEKTGQDVVISTGKDATKVPMKNSIVPEAKQIQEKGVEFIDSGHDIDDDVDAAFIEDNDVDDDDLDEFIEF